MNNWHFYTTNEIKPNGWLKNQLEIQAKGLSGNLDKIWPDVRDSAWIGGNREGWERVPYWLDGFIPLAYLLEDEDMINRAKKYIDAILKYQKPDGWICPCADEDRGSYDAWAVILITKVLTVYYDCSKDERIPSVVYNVLKNFYTLLKEEKIKLFDWGKFRWFEAFIALNFVWKNTQEDWILDLAKILKTQGADYNSFKELWKTPIRNWRFDTHIVNIAMALKAEAVSHELLGTDYTNEAEELYTLLKAYNGTAVELFTGDECLSGLSAIQGTELCSVVEQMYSYEQLFAHTGDSKWAERLEVIAFNALPATISEDMWTHQYVQMSNQIACETFPNESLFPTNKTDAHLFGLEPNFGCCTANFNQGWPKFSLFAFMHKGNTVINSMFLPSELNCGDKHIKLETNYPFENSMKYTINAEKDFTFKIRIPSFAETLTVNGEKAYGNELTFEIKSGKQTEIELCFNTTPFFKKRPNGLNNVQCGSLVFSVPVSYKKKMYEYERDGVERKFPYCDYELSPTSHWGWGLCESALTVNKKVVSQVPFSQSAPPITITATAQKIDWGLEDGFGNVCAKVPKSVLPISEKEEIELIPYGCARIRMTELPILK